MAFVPVTDPDRLRELGLAGLLWFRWSDGKYRHANRDRWEDYDAATIVGAASRGKYHLLLED